MTGCQCREAGWCERHKVYKTPHLWHLCQTRENYWVAWEEGRGPGQQLPEAKRGLGDMVADALGKVGITPQRYMDAKAALGLPRRCGCCGRKKKLNELGKKLGIG